MVRVNNHHLFRMTCIVKTSTYHKSKKGFCVKNKILFRQQYYSTAYLLLIPRLVDMQKILILLAFYFQCPLSLSQYKSACLRLRERLWYSNDSKGKQHTISSSTLIHKFSMFSTTYLLYISHFKSIFPIALQYVNRQTQNLSLSNMMQ